MGGGCAETIRIYSVWRAARRGPRQDVSFLTRRSAPNHCNLYCLGANGTINRRRARVWRGLGSRALGKTNVPLGAARKTATVEKSETEIQAEEKDL